MAVKVSVRKIRVRAIDGRTIHVTVEGRSGAQNGGQSDWAQDDPTKLSFIKNKPAIPAVDDAVSELSENPVKSSGIWGWVKGLLSDYLLKNNEDKGSVAVGAHEDEYGHDSFLTPEKLNNAEFQADSETGVISVKKIDASKVENLPALPEFISEKITANKTLTVGDGGKHFYSEATVDIEVTVVEGIKEPTSIFQKGAGRVKVVGDDGVTLYGKEWTISQFNGISVVPEDENTYHIIGGSDE